MRQKWDYKVCWMLDYKVWQNGLQSALAIAKCGRVGYKVRQGLQSVTGCITKSVRDCKMWHGRLQSASGITKCGGITK